MTDCIQMLKLLKDREGVTAVEYAIIAGVICVTLGAGFGAFANKLNNYLANLTL